MIAAIAGCSQEKRNFRELPPGGAPESLIRMGDLQPGGVIVTESTKSSYGTNAFALGEGKRLYDRMNCVGCHFHGGGGIGPALMDDKWIYGSDPAQVFATI